MGCNYYHRVNICAGCGRYDQHHIGKSSAGWTFSFHGERGDQLGEPVTSYADWLRRFESGGEIRDEYGDRISLAVFKQMVESKRSAALSHATYCADKYPGERERNWLDAEGHSFSEGEFS